MIYCDSDNCVYRNCNLECGKDDIVIENGVCMEFETVNDFLNKRDMVKVKKIIITEVDN